MIYKHLIKTLTLIFVVLWLLLNLGHFHRTLQNSQPKCGADTQLVHSGAAVALVPTLIGQSPRPPEAESLNLTPAQRIKRPCLPGAYFASFNKQQP